MTHIVFGDTSGGGGSSRFRPLAEAANATTMSGKPSFPMPWSYSLKEFIKEYGFFFGANDLKVWSLVATKSGRYAAMIVFLSRPEGDEAVKRFALMERLYEPGKRRAVADTTLQPTNEQAGNAAATYPAVSPKQSLYDDE
jgi:hypothetical protein